MLKKFLRVFNNILKIKLRVHKIKRDVTRIGERCKKLALDSKSKGDPE